jgi:general secretion pathway protein E
MSADEPSEANENPDEWEELLAEFSDEISYDDVAEDENAEDPIDTLSSLAGLTDAQLIEKMANFYGESGGNGRPTVTFVNHLLLIGHRLKACDLCIEPGEDDFRVGIRRRSTGQWAYPSRWIFTKRIFRSVLARFKILANMDIAERRIPQDGRFTIITGPEPIKLSVHTLPASDDEILVLRYCPAESSEVTFADLQLDEAITTRLDSIFTSSDKGLVFVAGTGGLSTTLKCLLQRYRNPDDRVMAITDGNQSYSNCINTNPNDAIGMDISNLLRAAIHQHPSILICDCAYLCNFENLSNLCGLAESGQRVLASIPINSAPHALSRLMDTGLEPYLVTSSVKVFIGQRLLRLLCADCKSPTDSGPYPFQASACPNCFQTGYSGRRAIFDVLFTADHNPNDLADWDYRSKLNAESTANFHEAALNLARQGLTSAPEARIGF